MIRFSLWAPLVFAGYATAVLFACAGTKDPVASDADLIGGSVDEVGSQATLTIVDSCTAAKVGPNHILFAAHCVEGRPASFAPGATIRIMRPSVTLAENNAGIQADAASPPPSVGLHQLTIDRVEVEPGRRAGCVGESCLLIDSQKAFETSDVAVIVTRERLDFIPVTARVDLDRVVPDDEIVLVGSGCEQDVREKFDYSRRRLKGKRTRAIDSSAGFHAGSQLNQFGDREATRTMFGGSYFLTPGPTLEQGAAGLCPGDSGGPVYRADADDVIVGVNASYTFSDMIASSLIPVTNAHTRLDTKSRFAVGTWLTSIGVATVHSCETRRCRPMGAPGPLPDAGVVRDGSTY